MTEKKSPMSRMKSLRMRKASIFRSKHIENPSVVFEGENGSQPRTEIEQLNMITRRPSNTENILNDHRNDLSPKHDTSSDSKSKDKHKKSGRLLSKLSTKSRSGSQAKEAYYQYVDLREIEICQQLGRGASSAGVFLCLVDGWACAMKQLKREHVGAIDIRCFEREMDILYQLPPHPNIVRYLFHTTMGTDLCLFMQLYSGTLREYLDIRRKENNYFAPEKITRMALEAAAGLQFLHQHGVIHRDIKAGNIFITKSENDEITRLAIGDFDTSLRVSASIKNLEDADIIPDRDPDGGFIKANQTMNTAQKRSYFSQNRPRSTVGTAGWMAPEVLRSKKFHTLWI